MASALPVTVCVLVERYTKQLATCLRQLTAAHEVVLVVTSEESISPRKLSSLHPNITLCHYTKTPLHFAEARLLGLKTASQPWVLFLDSDEVLTPGFWDEVAACCSSRILAGARITRRDVFLGKPLRYAEGGALKLLRLVRKNQAQITGAVHEVLTVPGKVGEIESIVLHYSHENISSFLSKISRYARAAAEEKPVSPVRNFLELLFWPAGKLLYTLLIKQGIRDGWRGVVYAVMMSLHSLSVRVYRFEKAQQKLSQRGLQLTGHILWYCLLLVALSLGQLQRLQVTPSIAMYAHDAVVLSWLLYLGRTFWQKLIQKHKNPAALRKTIQKYSKLPVVWLGLWLFITTVLASLSLGTIIPVLYLARAAAYLTVAWLLAQTKVVPRSVLFGGLLWLSVMWLVFGSVQLLFFPDLRSLKWLGFDDHYYRLSSSMLDPNFAGILLVGGAIAWLSYLLPTLNQRSLSHQVRSARAMSYIFALPVVSIFFAGVAATYSRASYLSLAAALIVLLMVLQQYRQTLIKLVLGAAVVAVCAWLALPKPGGEGVALTRTASISARSTFAAEQLALIEGKRWILGSGLYTTTSLTSTHREQVLTNHARVPDSLILLLLVAGGIPAVLLGAWSVLEWGRTSLQWDPYYFAWVTAVLLHAQFNNTLLEPIVLLTLAIATVTASLSQDRRDERITTVQT